MTTEFLDNGSSISGTFSLSHHGVADTLFYGHLYGVYVRLSVKLKGKMGQQF